MPERGTPDTTVTNPLEAPIRTSLSQPPARALRAARPPPSRPRVTCAGAAATHETMRPDDALSWLRQVKGQLYCNNRHPSGTRAWVAVVRTPRHGARNGKLIIALGSTMEEAASAAEGQWKEVWRGIGPRH